MTEQPNVVLIHGAFADGSSWSAVVEDLQAKGYQVTAPQFPLTSLADDVARLRQALAWRSGPTIVVGHSYGGQVMTALGDDVANVVALAYVAAFGLDEGESINSVAADAPSPAMTRISRTEPAPPRPPALPSTGSRTNRTACLVPSPLVPRLGCRVSGPRPRPRPVLKVYAASLPAGDMAPLATYRPRVTGVEPHPDFGICRACGRGLLLDDGVLPEHPADPEHGRPERTPIPEDHRCRGEGHPPL
jgi:pimeloyl-ACP methyl ester carboxylesterase